VPLWCCRDASSYHVSCAQGDTKSAIGSIFSDASQQKVNRIRGIVTRLTNGQCFPVKVATIVPDPCLARPLGKKISALSKQELQRKRTDTRFLLKSCYSFANCRSTLDMLFHIMCDATNALKAARNTLVTASTSAQQQVNIRGTVCICHQPTAFDCC